jgi:transposase-like protein
MDDEGMGYVIILVLILAFGFAVISILIFISLLFLALLIIFIPLIVFGYVKTKNKRRCPYCSISMGRLEEEEKKAFQCPECLRIFRDKPKKKIEKQDYKNLGWLRYQYYDLQKNIQEIADEQNVSMITIKKWVDKLDSTLKDLDEKEFESF